MWPCISQCFSSRLDCVGQAQSIPGDSIPLEEVVSASVARVASCPVPVPNSLDRISEKLLVEIDKLICPFEFLLPGALLPLGCEDALHRLSQLDRAVKKELWLRFAIGGNLPTIQFLINGVIDATILNAVDKDGNTALIMAASLKDNSDAVPIVDMLLQQKGIDVNAADHWGRTAMMTAACDGNAGVVDSLLSKVPHSKLNQTDSSGNTALILAVSEGHFSIALALLKNMHGADIKAANNMSLTAMDHALYRQDEKMVQLLQCYGAESAMVSRGLSDKPQRHHSIA